MTYRRLALMLCAALGIISCNKQALTEGTNVTGLSATDKVEYRITASSAETKTAVSSDGIVWSTGDKLAISYMHGGEPECAIFEHENGNSFVGEISTPDEPCDWYALYPSTAAGEAGVSLSIPAESGQQGNGSMAHLAGEGFPLWGKALQVAGGDIPNMQMEQLAAVINFNVTNQETSPIKVSKVIFTAPVDMAGEFSGSMTETEWSPVPGNATKTATLNVLNGEEIASGESASFYMGVMPFSTTGDFDITIMAECGGKQVSSVKNVKGKTMAFPAGEITRLNYKFTISVEEPTLTYAFFASDLHGDSSTIPAILSYVKNNEIVPSLDFACLIGDIVGSGGSDAPAFQTSDTKSQITGTYPDAQVLISYGSHDAGANDNASILNRTACTAYQINYPSKDEPDYYVYSIPHESMTKADNAESDAQAFKNWAATVDATKPIVIVSHVPTIKKRNDNLGATYWHSAMNTVATGSANGTKAARNVLFFSGHNHTVDQAEYYYEPGAKMSIQGTSKSASSEVTIYYTYSVTGYIKTSQSGTVMKVTDDSIELAKYKSSGLVSDSSHTIARLR